MITWFTRFSFDKTAVDLTDHTLGRQIFEGYEVFKVLTGRESEEMDIDHPVCRMWEGYEFALGLYVMSMGDQFTRIRRNIDTTFFTVYNDMQVMKADAKKNDERFTYEAPPWFKDADLARSHRSNLARRQPHEYGKTWPGTPANMPYLWPFIDEDDPTKYDLMVSKAERALLKSGERSLPKDIKKRVANL